MALSQGTRFGPYEVAGLVGVGGMGEVYRATDLDLKRDVALKVLPEELLTDANRLARLQREAEVLASLNHANIAHIYGLERCEGRTALVMELVDGITLAERLAQGPLPPAEALKLAMQIAAALEAAHERNVVHRDLKPANIKLKADGTVKVLDFGIAKALDLRAASGPQPPALTTPTMTEAGMVLGTAAYMSPEQARGLPVDKRADIWAFGCVLYEMLTGKAAFLGDDVTTTLARVLERDPDLRVLPLGLAPAVRRTLELCLRKDVRKRLADIRDVRLALDGEFAEAAGPFRQRLLPVAAGFVAGALLAGVFVANLASPAGPASALPVTSFVFTPPATAPLTNFGGLDLAISRDGERLVYFARDPASNRIALYARELDSLEARLIPGTEMGGAANLFLSPDGMSVGYALFGQGVTRVAVDGGQPLKMFDSPHPDFRSAAWATDDTLIVAAGTRLWRVSAGGGSTPVPLTPQVANEFVTVPHLLPGERAVLFGVVEANMDRVAVLDLDTAEQKILIEDGAHPTYADTGHIVFTRGTTLMAAPFDASDLVLTGEPVALLQGVRDPGVGSASDYALSATGTLVYVPGTADPVERATLVWVDRAGAVVARATNDLIDGPRDPRVSPDGQRLVVTTGGSVDGSLWSYDLRGRPPLPLARGNDSRSAVWSPDGRHLAFVAARMAGSTIFTLPADSSALAPQRVPTEGATGIPNVWSADGELLFTTGPSTPNIRVVPATAVGEVRDVLATDDAESDAALSPNGRWLAYVSTRTGRGEVWVQGYPNGAPVRISQSGGYEPRWSADGRELFYLQGDAVVAVPVDTEGEFSFAAPVELFRGAYRTFVSPLVHSYDVGRDGRFLMIQPESEADAASGASIVVVLNWFEELRRRVPVQR